MVGEIRDAETARIAIESALTGHMVLSTLHTNDAPGTIVRLSKMGIEPFLTASALDCVVAQRLARKLCTHCKQRTVISARGAARGRLPGRRRPRGLRAGRAARAATAPAIEGRIGLFSVMVMSEEIKELTVERRRRGRDQRGRARARAC